MRASTAGLHERIGYFAWAFESLPALADIAESVRSRSQDTSDDIAGRIRYAARNAFRLETARAGNLEGLETTTARGQGEDQLYWAPGGSGEFPFGFRTPARYADVVDGPGISLSIPRVYFGSDVESLDARVDAAAYRLMLNCFVMSFAGDPACLPWLGLLMLRGPLDRQFTIARFLNTMTNTSVVGRYDGPPGRALVLEWVRAIDEGDVFLRSTIDLAETVDTYLVALRRS
ncbi:hypothetical protein ACH3Y9_33540 [Streptomyces sp. WSLK1-5]|uniref:hypothetical protein n=1 Tax=unclassified Streptomyces TaxID=2593676 RepID=UPI003799CABE